VSVIVPECTTRYEALTGVVPSSAQAGRGQPESSVPLPDTAPARLPEIIWTKGQTCHPRSLRGTRSRTQVAWQPLQTKVHVMAIAIYTALLPVCSFIIGVFGFFVGRCARKIPILDDNLPRALHRGQLPPNYL